MINKVFYIPNLKISNYHPLKFQVRNLFGVTCFVASGNDNIVQHSITDDLCKNIITMVFNIGKRLKEAGRFEEKTLYDMYSLRTIGGKKLLITDEDYIKWSGINQDSLHTLIKYVEEFMNNFGMINLWPVIDRIMLVGDKENIDINMRDEEGRVLEVNKSNMWWYHDKDGSHEVQPLIFILEYIARLYLYHTKKDESYFFTVDLSCQVNYLGEKYDMGFRGHGLDLLIDIAYLHTVADPNMELSECACGTWFYKNLLKKQQYCNRKCTNRFNIRKFRKAKEEKEG